jgi:SAM-dependent methyltransferase
VAQLSSRGARRRNFAIAFIGVRRGNGEWARTVPVPLLRQIVPVRVRRALRRSWFGACDVADRLRGRRDDLRPGRWLQYAVGGDWDDAGTRFLEHFVAYGGLCPEDRVLDIGCGAGRIAASLGPYLAATGSYEGFDLYAPGVRWCSAHLTPRWPNFHFQHVDVRDPQNNRRGELEASRFDFPYPDASFDFAFLTSVFTHLRPAAASRYLAEISRVLRPGGRCVGSWFVLDDESWPAVLSGTTQYGFGGELEGCRVARLDLPEIAVAHPREMIEAMVASAGLELQEPVVRGNWFGVADAVEHQDLVVVRRP